MSHQLITYEEYLSIYNAATRPLHKLYIKLLWASAGRSTEVAELKAENVSAITEQYLVMKNKKQHETFFDKNTGTNKPIHHPRSKIKQVFITDDAITSLADYIEENNIGPGQYIFSNGDRTYPWTKVNCWYVVTRAAKIAGVMKVNREGKIKPAWPHTFRHGQATFMLHEIKDIIMVKEHLGHANVNTTQIYTALSIEEKQAYIRQIEHKTRGATNTE